ncbi:MAG: RNA polymerase sigma-70 factor [Flavihumibacter sp.]
MENDFPHDENRLLRQLATGDHHAFRIIYDHYWSKVFALALRKTGNSAEAEEIVQEIFTDLWQRQGRLQIQKTLSHYLSTAVKYKVIDLFEKQAVRQRFRRSELAQLPATASLPDYVRIKELKDSIAALTNALPEKCRLVFQLSRQEGLNHEEIANKLNISTKTVESHLTRALRYFRTGLQQFFFIFFLSG